MTDPLRTIAAILERSLHASQADRAALAAIARAGDAGQRARIDMRRFVECAMSTRQQSERDEPLAHAESIAAQIAAVEAIAVSDAPHTAGHFPVSDRAKAAVARLEAGMVGQERWHGRPPRHRRRQGHDHARCSDGCLGQQARHRVR